MTAYGIMSAAPGVPDDAGSGSTIAGTTEGAVAAAMGRLAELQSDTLAQGSVLGDPMPLPGVVFSDTTELQPEPGTGPNMPQAAPHQGGSYDGKA